MDNKENMEQQPTPEEPLSDQTNAATAEAVETEAEDGVAEASEVEAEALSVEALQAELEEQRQQAQEHLGHLQRLQAEFNNYRRRMAQEKLQAAGRGKEELLSSLLPVLNNLRLAVQHADQNPESVRQGVQMIWQQCEEFLRQQGVEAIPTVGHPFDPSLHEALSIAPATDETPANTVVSEINAGYTLNGQLLRPAQVVVAQADEPEVAESEEVVPEISTDLNADESESAGEVAEAEAERSASAAETET